MRYLILVGHDEKGGLGLTPQQHAELFAAYQKYHKDLKQSGALLGGEALQSSAKGARIRVEGGKRKVLDGPFSESKEIIGGFFLIEAKSHEDALEWAARCPAAHLGGWSYVELRPVEEIST
ncbi:MAG: YciI family protein [Myxococcota bacterium]